MHASWFPLGRHLRRSNEAVVVSLAAETFVDAGSCQQPKKYGDGSSCAVRNRSCYFWNASMSASLQVAKASRSMPLDSAWHLKVSLHSTCAQDRERAFI
mmetsp:Transcript_4434/g.6932  ORF Transcript_4434/g.6932 Transcript_4434/m.6932 type:complete len:99 (-) Transcript_4434:86-382(-)